MQTTNNSTTGRQFDSQSDKEFLSLHQALEGRSSSSIARSLNSLKSMLGSNDPEQLSLLLSAESFLVDSGKQFISLREDILLGLINRLRSLEYNDLLMTCMDQMSHLLHEQGLVAGAARCETIAKELSGRIFGESYLHAALPQTGKVTRARAGSSSTTGRAYSVPLDLSALQTRSILASAVYANKALQRGLRYFQAEDWRSAKGSFLSAAWTIERPEATVRDGILLQAYAQFMLAACYIKTFEHELAIPYARHAVAIYQRHPEQRQKNLYRSALFTLEEALSLHVENFLERDAVRRAIEALDKE
jgi:hypothetical protein